MTSATALPGTIRTLRPQSPAVSARAVVRRHGNGRGVGPIDIDVLTGETLALMGRNGCGKTTLLRLLATVSRPRGGRLRWFGGAAGPARSHIGMALDSALEDPGLTGRQATHFWCAQWIADRHAVVARTDAILHRLGIAATADEPVASYSFGMRRRLALAAALVHEPALALLDEPTAGLDPQGCGQLAGLLRARSHDGRSTVVASNDAGFVEEVADRVAFIEEGELVRCATPRELLAGLPRGRIADLVVDAGGGAAAAPAATLRAVTGVLDVRAEGATLTVRFTDDRAVAAIVAAADAPGGRLRELRLRRPDLGDCFTVLTGRPLREGS